MLTFTYNSIYYIFKRREIKLKELFYVIDPYFIRQSSAGELII